MNALMKELDVLDRQGAAFRVRLFMVGGGTIEGTTTRVDSCADSIRLYEIVDHMPRTPYNETNGDGQAPIELEPEEPPITIINLASVWKAEVIKS